MSELVPANELGCSNRGKFVDIRLGNRSCSIDYDTAFRFAVLIWGNAKIAKKTAGDASPGIYGFANLTDAVQDEIKAQRRRDGTAGYSLR